MRYFTFLIIFIMGYNLAFAKPFRVNQYPHGQQFQCLGCHMSAGGGDARNSFGLDVEDNLEGGNVNWGPELASLDSDGDGFTNGEELLDPNGEWEIGDSDPGDSENVTAPFDSDDFPTGINNIAEKFIAFEFTSNNVFDNNISFSVNSELSEEFSIRIVNSNGAPVDLIYQGDITNSNFQWQGFNSFGSSVSAGLYYIEIKSHKYTIYKKILKI